MRRFWVLGLLLLFWSVSLLCETGGESSLQTHEKSLGELELKIEKLKKDESTLKSSERNLSQELAELEKRVRLSTIKQNFYQHKSKRTKLEVENLKGEVKKYEGMALSEETKLIASLKAYHHFIVPPERLHLDIRPKMILQNKIGEESTALKEAELKKSATQKLGMKKTVAQKEYEKQELLWRSKSQEVKSVKQEKVQIFSQIQKKKKLTESELKELEEHKKQLESLIAKLRRDHIVPGESPGVMRAYFLARKGTLEWPVRGEIVSKFGRQRHPSLNIVTINNGVRIKTNHSGTVKAIEQGKVIFASEFKSYGLTVIIDHGGDIYSIYGLLSDLKVQKGIKVAKGQTIGAINNSSEPQLYFEFRNGGTPEDPVQWMQ